MSDASDIAVEDSVKNGQTNIMEKEGNWTCECGNVNYWDRSVCNMRTCNKRNPASGNDSKSDGWTCSECGNKNYADRMECNMRQCRAPRDARKYRPRFQQFYRPGPDRDVRYKPQIRGGPYDRQDDVGRSFKGKGEGKGEGKGSNWMCECGNDNFADREFCNMRKCGLPRPRPRNFDSARRASGRRDQDGWVCECGNLNFADRMTCNMRKCGLPKNQGGNHGGNQGGMRSGSRRFEERTETYRPSGPMRSGASRSSKPMWICECGNENFEDREICNMHKCGRPKPADGVRVRGRDVQTGSTALRDRDGNIAETWICECGNKNFADRDVCNMRKCGLPRPEL
eukprot:GEMP01009205.1.p1 GENE.GEMP01009205.1~~GEMP01009205.1.p1  ORF type:complete len:341 (+),score=70.36 GEMP01009205.1:1295-2317(+)